MTLGCPGNSILRMASPSVAGGPDRVAEWGRSLLWLNLLATSVVFSARTTEGFERPKTAVVRGVGLVLAVWISTRVTNRSIERARRRAQADAIAGDASDQGGIK